MLRRGVVLLVLLWGAAPAGAQAPRTWRAAGQATNLAVDQSGQVTLIVSTNDSVVFTATGQYNQGLVGRFTMNGRVLPVCETGHICVQFSGSLQMGGEGGWPEGTQALYVMTLVLAPAAGTGSGVYHMAPFGESDFYQHGILDLTLN